MPHRPSPDGRAERTIVAARIALAGSTLFALWLDQTEPAQFTRLTYGLHMLYVLYTLALAGFVWYRPTGRGWPLVTHIIDILVFSTFHVLTHGPSSPFYAFFLFSMFCGALRWGWRGTVVTAATVLTIFVAIGFVMSTGPGPAEYEINLFVIRSVYLAIAAVLLVYLGLHEARLRVENERLAEELRQMAVREERVDVSRDLHDGVLQALTGIRLELGSIGEALSKESRLAVHERMVNVERALAGEQRELRLFIEGLRPARPLPVLSLPQRLERLRNRLAPHGRASLDIRLTPPDLSLPGETEGALLMMVHEAVVNALRHASPSHVVVEIGLSDDRLHVRISDDGRGFAFHGRFDHAELERSNLGPLTLRERAAKLGGQLSIESSRAGSKIELQLPVRSGAA
jgi:signal transduction histidine kinase